jgi:hypothetical protein
MDQVVAGLKYQIMITYVDDCLLYHGHTFEEHLRSLNVVFNRLQKSGLKLSIAKCSFCMKSFEYLGVDVSRDGLRPSPRNVNKILNSRCESWDDLRSFIGIAQFYRRYARNFAQVVKPLYDAITFKQEVRGNSKIQEKVNIIKKALSEYPVLRHPDFDKRFFLATDGSHLGFGSVLFQEDDAGLLYVVAYASSGLMASHKKLYGPQLEAAAACWAMMYFRHYLIGTQFTLLTDQIVLKYLKQKDDVRGVIAAFALESLEFDYTIKHVPGKKHVLPDFLSRISARDSPPDVETFAKQERVYMNQI